MSDQGVRPRKLSHYAGIAVVAAIIWHNPGGSAELAITALDKVGSAVAFGMNSVGMDGESDYFVEKQPADSGTPGREVGPPVTIDVEPGPTVENGFETLGPLNGTADKAVVGIVNLHEVVEAVLAEGGASS